MCSENTTSKQPDANEVTRVLASIGAGDRRAFDELLPLVYDELRSIAARHLAGEAAGHTLQPTALVHEAYLRLLGGEQPDWNSRAHFFGAAALAMRRILVERARRNHRLKHGGDQHRVPLSVAEAADEPERDALDILALDEALRRMEREDERMSQVVMLRFFAGLSLEDTARAMEISERTVKRCWRCARAWLYDELDGGGV